MTTTPVLPKRKPLVVSEVHEEIQPSVLPISVPEKASAETTIGTNEEYEMMEVITGDFVEQKWVKTGAHKQRAGVTSISRTAKHVAMKQITSPEHAAQKFTSPQVVGLRALLQMAVQESLSVTQVFDQSGTYDFGPGEAPFAEFARIDRMLKSGITVDEIITTASTASLPILTAPETQVALVRLVEDQGFHAVATQVNCTNNYKMPKTTLNLANCMLYNQAVLKEAAEMIPRQPVGLKAVLRAVETKTANMEDIVEMAIHPKEFNLRTPVPEMAEMSIYLNEGVSCQEMLSLIEAGELPSLNKPETQWPLIEIIDKLGQIATVSEVIVEEATLGKSKFRFHIFLNVHCFILEKSNGERMHAILFYLPLLFFE